MNGSAEPQTSMALETDRLGKRYGDTWALRDCSLHLPEGRIAALVGPNGAGKTTLLHLAVGLLRPGRRIGRRCSGRRRTTTRRCSPTSASSPRTPRCTRTSPRPS